MPSLSIEFNKGNDIAIELFFEDVYWDIAYAFRNDTLLLKWGNLGQQMGERFIIFLIILCGSMLTKIAK